MYKRQERKEGSTLCTAHDDGGVITAYGYGYYWESSSQKPTLTESGGFVMDGGDTEEARAAASALGAQMPEYTFTAYETGETGLRLQSASDANGTWILNRGTSRSYTYTVCPFFADAFGYAGDAEPGTDQAAYQVRSVQQLQFINWSWYNDSGSVNREMCIRDRWGARRAFPSARRASSTR